MKRRGATKSRINCTNPDDDKVIISSEYFEDTRPSYICSICNQTLVRLTDAGGNNQTYWCRNCSVEWDPTEENVRRESKLSVPDRNEETLVAYEQYKNEAYPKPNERHFIAKPIPNNEIIRRVNEILTNNSSV